MRLSQKSKRWLSASSLNASNIEKLPLNSCTSPSKPLEPLAVGQSQARPRRLAQNRLAKRQSGSHRTLARANWPDFVFAFHDDEEIGPRMLARIAKQTGLTPEDL